MVWNVSPSATGVPIGTSETTVLGPIGLATGIDGEHVFVRETAGFSATIHIYGSLTETSFPGGGRWAILNEGDIRLPRGASRILVLPKCRNIIVRASRANGSAPVIDVDVGWYS